MILLAFIALFAQEPQPLSSSDVAAIMTASIRAAIAGRQPALPTPLLIAVDDANVKFEAVTGASLPIIRSAWLPGTPHEQVDMFSAIQCPVKRLLAPNCRMSRPATVVHLLAVETETVGASYRLSINVVHQDLHQADKLGGYTAIVQVVKTLHGWDARVLARAAG